jgi:ATP-dependent HslUV protease subunit HslV
MTVAVAVHKNGRTVLAADSLVHFGGQRFSAENCRFHKIARVGTSYMAWAGWSLYSEMLTAHLATQTPPPVLETEEQVFSFFIGFWRMMRDEYTLSVRAHPDDSPFHTLDSTFLFVNPGGIFRIASDMDVTEFEQYTAIGSGSKYALGALRVLYDSMGDAVEIAGRAVQVGIDLDVYCGGPVELVEAHSQIPEGRKRP